MCLRAQRPHCGGFRTPLRISVPRLAATTDENRGQVMGMRGSAISLAVMLGPLAQALVGLWLTPQITFAIGVALSFVMALVAFLLLKNPGRAENV